MKKAKSLLGVGLSFFILWLCLGAGMMVQYKEFPSFSWPVFSVASGGMILAVALPAILVLVLVLAGVMRGKWHE